MFFIKKNGDCKINALSSQSSYRSIGMICLLIPLSNQPTLVQGRIQDLKKEGAQWLRGLAPNTFLANLGDFLKNFGQKGVGVRPPPLDPRLLVRRPLCTPGLRHFCQRQRSDIAEKFHNSQDQLNSLTVACSTLSAHLLRSHCDPNLISRALSMSSLSVCSQCVLCRSHSILTTLIIRIEPAI